MDLNRLFSFSSMHRYNDTIIEIFMILLIAKNTECVWDPGSLNNCSMKIIILFPKCSF